jgi:hypothetical protein
MFGDDPFGQACRLFGLGQVKGGETLRLSGSVVTIEALNGFEGLLGAPETDHGLRTEPGRAVSGLHLRTALRSLLRSKRRVRWARCNERRLSRLGHPPGPTPM